jgi:hypothetical protein
MSAEIDSTVILQKALFWSEKADMEEMDAVLDIFKDSP